MSGFYGIDNNREVIRVHVKKCDGLMQPESKKFSIDPQITSFEMLQNLLAKAFDIKSDFTISYLSQDGGQEVYLSMLSDWDMDAAFQNASDPCLKLKVELKPFDETLEDWDIIAPVEIPQYRMAFLDKGTFLGNITGTISNRVERTVSHVQRVIGMKSEDEQQYRPIKSPMTDMEFRNYLDSDGHMVKPEEFRLSIYQGGIEPSLRRVVWRHLLNIYPKDMSGRERFDYMKKKEKEYFELRDKWRNLFSTRQVSEEAKHVASLVKKDVLRTDRGHKYYSGGDDSKNLVALYNLLVTYALTHPEVSYCQGMSDIASPLLVVQKEEAQAYLCFCGLMKRLRSNFMYDGEAITTKLQHLSTLVQFYDPVFNAYMKSHGAEDLFFCYRWLLLEMKREFPFEDALYMLEVMWSTIPPCPPEGQLELCDTEYSPALMMSVSPNSPSFGLKTQYSHLLAKRRMTCHVKENAESKSPKVSQSPKSTSTSYRNFVNDGLTDIQEEKCGSVEKSGNKSVENGRSESTESNSSKDSSPVETVPLSLQNGSASQEKADLENSYQNSRYMKKSSEENGKENSNTETDEGVANSSTGSSNSSSYMSASQSIERFPSLITASVEDKTELNDSEVISVSESKTLTDNGTVLENIFSDTPNCDQSVGKQEVDVTGHSRVPHSEDESEDQAQFHLSLDETDRLVEKKKNNIPQIKGSFFSGMKRILSSPKRRPGQSQQCNGKTMVHKANTKTENNNKSINTAVQDLKLSPRNGDEHTLFEVNRMIKSLNSIPKEPGDSDSGTGSLTSSTNSIHVLGIKNRSSSQGSEKPVEVLTKDQRDFFDKKYKETVCDIPKAKKDIGTLCSDNTPSFCVDHFNINSDETARTDESKDAIGISDCVEATDPDEGKLAKFKQLPTPDEFGYGNPFLMFLCLTVLLQHRDIIMKSGMEYDELAMYFDKMVRKHNVNKVLHQTRIMYTEYIRMQQKLLEGDEEEEEDFHV
ncbi:TBC1 domain family member 25-like [Mercenaria mercenaria]|uniref:TBC1 domain family member 25-like n=1 Tax=Mercenaria mercenaria TaxID=6596 RepID=UPI00234EA022|nr:TBC1 domain family member 25-like [Mercenaria mercenaria]